MSTRKVTKIKKHYTHVKTHVKTHVNKLAAKIIHIDGIPGAGKTYICSKITHNDAVCIDNDDIVLYAQNYVDSLLGTDKEIPRTFKSLNKVIKKKVDELIKENIAKGKKVIIFVGVRFMVDTALNNADYRYFIKLNDLGATFRRVFLRETEKIAINYEAIKHIINNPKIEEIKLDDMVNRQCNLALPYPPEFNQYKKHYKRAMGVAKENNYKVMKQDDIIKAINNFLHLWTFKTPIIPVF
jgi:hypothetical protein